MDIGRGFLHIIVHSLWPVIAYLTPGCHGHSSGAPFVYIIAPLGKVSENRSPWMDFKTLRWYDWTSWKMDEFHQNIIVHLFLHSIEYGIPCFVTKIKVIHSPISTEWTTGHFSCKKMFDLSNLMGITWPLVWSPQIGERITLRKQSRPLGHTKWKKNEIIYHIKYLFPYSACYIIVHRS
jgi:hypothetical protein